MWVDKIKDKIYINMYISVQSDKMNILNNKYEKRSRFKLKQIDKMTIYDVFIIKMLADTSDKLYLYVDDRSLAASISQKMIDDTMNILRMFNIKLPDIVVRYTDYYDTAWVYLHRLLTLKKAVLNYNTINKTTDLGMFSKTKNVKIVYNNDVLAQSAVLQWETLISKEENNSQNKIRSQNMNRYDNILYDYGWFRDIFIEIIIDYCERIDKIVDEISEIDTEQTQKINTLLITQLRSTLKFKDPEKVFTNLVTTIKNMRNKYIPDKIRISNISLRQLHEIGIDMKIVREIIEKDDDTLISHAYDMDKNCKFLLNDPIKIDLSQQKEINIDDKIITINGIYIDKDELISLNLNPQNLNQTILRIKSVGCMMLSLCNTEYIGTIIHLKKRNNDQLNN